LSESLHAHEESVRILESHLIQLTEQKDELELAQDRFDLIKEDLQNQILQLEHQLEQTNEKLQVAQDADNDSAERMDALKREAKLKLDAVTDELKSARNEIAQLKKENALLRDSTLVGEKQRELDREKAENRDNLALIDQMRIGLENAVAERDQLASRILEDENKIGMLVAERVVEEREHSRILERTLKNVQQRLEDEIEKVTDLENGRQALVAEIDDLLSWKAVYESGHGLQELAKNMKTLKDNNRRLSMAVDQLTSRVGMLMDANGLASHAFDRLKKECGKDPNFNYPEYELQEELASEKAKLKGQVAELEEQVNSLEEDCVRLRKALKNQAGVVGEKGFKYAGMTAEQLMKVNEFASNLKDGIVELPLNDRSAELLKENRMQNDNIRMLKIQIESLERELGTSASGTAQRQQPELLQPGFAPALAATGLNKKQEAELFGLREDVQRLIHENGELRDGMLRMQSEVMILLRSQTNKVQSDGTPNATGSGSVSGGPQNDVLNMLLSTNESLLSENQELKRYLTSNRAFQQSNVPHHEAGAASPNPLAVQIPGSAAGQQFSSTMASTMDMRMGTANMTAQHLRPPAGRKAVPAAHTPVGRGHQSTSYAHPEWTPMGMSGMGGMGVFNAGYQSLGVPSTPHGKQLLTRNLSQMNLPPEEWASEVKDLNAQLVECLEQLFEREQELEEQQQQIIGLEDTLVCIKQQSAALYYDFAKRMDAWEEREKNYKAELSQLRNSKEDLSLRVSKTESVITAMTQQQSQGDRDSLVLDLNRKVLIMEVNESILSRKFISLDESLALEQETRKRLEKDFVEMESILKKRILYLEQYKAAMSSRLGQLQGRVDRSVPVEDFLAVQEELDSLREDHLQSLRREVEARILVLKSQDRGTELRMLKLNMVQLQSTLTHAEESCNETVAQLEHQKMLTERALANNFEYASTVTEMAKFRLTKIFPFLVVLFDAMMLCWRTGANQVG
jgi:outer membrane murein-binding lipoprotein Lpp